jgi:ubiquitin-like 1-activating enzyme E1 A
LTGVAAEVCKNIVLAGVKSLTILDPNPFGEMELGARFLIPHGEESKPKSVSAVPRLQALNPNVEVLGDSGQVEEKEEEFFTHFDVVCMTNCHSELQVKVNEVCRKHSIKFYSADTWGYYGYYFVDLGNHEYVEEVSSKAESMDVEQKKKAASKHTNGKDEQPDTRMEKKQLLFCKLSDALQFQFAELPPKHFRRNPKTVIIIRILQEFFNKYRRNPSSNSEVEDKSELELLRSSLLKGMGLAEDFLASDFSKLCFGELSPVCAIVGGVLAQEMIKVRMFILYIHVQLNLFSMKLLYVKYLLT